MDSLLESLVNLYTLEQNNRQQNNSPDLLPIILYHSIFKDRDKHRPVQVDHINRVLFPPQLLVLFIIADIIIILQQIKNNLNQQFSAYLSIIQTLRDIGNQYNNNMREYNETFVKFLILLMKYAKIYDYVNL